MGSSRGSPRGLLNVVPISATNELTPMKKVQKLFYMNCSTRFNIEFKIWKDHLFILQNWFISAQVEFLQILHILSPATIHAGTRGTYCHPKARILSPGWNFYPAFIVVGGYTCQSVPHILSPYSVKCFNKITG